MFGLPALAVADGILQAATIAKFLNLAIGIVASGVNAVGKLGELNAFIQKLVDEEREPTEEEWAAWGARSDAAHATIQNARA